MFAFLSLSLLFLGFYFYKNFKANSFYYNQLSKLKILSEFLNRNKTLKIFKNYIANKLSSLNINPVNIDNLSTLFIFVYIILLGFGLLIAFLYSAIWYISLLLFLSFSVIPFLILNLAVDYFTKKVTKELPFATEEISQGFRVNGTLIGSIKYGLPHMEKHSKALFNNLANSLEHDYHEKSINKFLINKNNKWLNTLGVIFLTYSKKGGDLSHHLDYFVDIISYFFINRDKNKYAFFMPKLVLIVIVLAIPLAISLMSSMFPAARVIYMTDTKALTLLALCIISSIISFIVLLFLERR